MVQPSLSLTKDLKNRFGTGQLRASRLSGNGLVKIGSLKISMIDIQWQWKILPDLKSDQRDPHLTRNQSLLPGRGGKWSSQV